MADPQQQSSAPPPPPPGFVPESSTAAPPAASATASPQSAGSTSAVPPPPPGFVPEGQMQPPSAMDSVKGALSDAWNGKGSGVAPYLVSQQVGALKGVGETAHTIGRLINAATGDNVSWLPASLDEPKELESSNVGQSMGKIGESIAEFALGDEALKGMSIMEKLGMAQKITEFAKESPTLAKLVTLGLNAVRGGAVGGAVGGAHGGVKGAETGAALGAGAELAAPVISKAGDIAKGAGDLASQVIKGEKVAQPAAEQALRSGVEAGAKEAEITVAQPKSLRASLEDPIQTLHASAKDLYHQVDTAAGTDFKALYEKLDNTESQIRELTDTEEDVAKEAKLEKSRQGLIDKINDAKAQAQSRGVDPKLLDQADAQFKQKSAMQDVETKLFKNPNVIEGNAAYGTPETIKLDSATKVLQKLKDTTKYGGSRLEQAFGKEGADNLLRNMYEAQRNGVRAASRQDIAKWVAKAAGVSGLALAAGEKILGQ